MTPHSPARGPGRPKDQDKRAAILAAATTLFLARGYAEVTMESVAAAARVSKMTVYGHFRDKATLFGAVVRATSDQMTAALTGLPGAGSGRDLEARLTAVGTALLGLILSPRVVAMSHALMAMLMKDRALAAAFYDAGPGNTRAALARFLEEASGQRLLRLDSPQDAADDLLGLWEGDLPKRIALGLAPAPTPAEIEARARRAVRVFLRAYGGAAP